MNKNTKIADVCLIIENSYPYTTGGVASWVQRLIKSYKNTIRFAVVALTNEHKTIQNMRYSLPDNVISFKYFNLSDYTILREAEPVELTSLEQNQIYLHIKKFVLSNSFRNGSLNNEDIQLFIKILEDYKASFFKHILLSESGSHLFGELYKKHGKNGFLKYYYNLRNLQLKIWRVFLLINSLPKAKIYHATSTGFAGFLVCMMTALYKKPSVITEHSIYIEEKEMDLSKAKSKSLSLDETDLLEMWRNFFQILTEFEYKTVTKLITYSEGNKELLIEYGANPKTVRVIPNGIEINLFIKARRTRITSQPLVIGMVGRIDEGKDIKTFLNVVANIVKVHPTIQAYLIGQQENESYYQECLALRELLNLEEVVIFTGYTGNLIDYYKKMDVLLLTSIKSTMPLVIMEAMACGLPVVATKVGACQELLYGIDDDLGEAGYIANVMDSIDIATKTMRILSNPKLANKMGQIGIQRIDKYYSENNFIDKYSIVYKKMISQMRRQNINRW